MHKIIRNYNPIDFDYLLRKHGRRLPGNFHQGVVKALRGEYPHQKKNQKTGKNLPKNAGCTMTADAKQRDNAKNKSCETKHQGCLLDHHMNNCPQMTLWTVGRQITQQAY